MLMKNGASLSKKKRIGKRRSWTNCSSGILRTWSSCTRISRSTNERKTTHLPSISRFPQERCTPREKDRTSSPALKRRLPRLVGSAKNIRRCYARTTSGNESAPAPGSRPESLRGNSVLDHEAPALRGGDICLLIKCQPKANNFEKATELVDFAPGQSPYI